jgi:integrase
MPKLHLTDIAVKSLSPEKTTEYFCTTLPGFGIRVSPTGTRTWFAAIGPSHKRTKVTLGRYPTMNLKAARRAAAMLDPNTDAVPSFREARDRYLAEAKRNLRSRTYEEAERHLKALDFDDLDLSLNAILRALDGLPPSVANHRWAYLKVFLNHCDALYRTGNPLRMRKKPFKLESRDRVLSDPELKAIFTAAGELGTYGRLVRFLMFSGCRRTEAANIRHSWIRDGWLTIPGAHTKNGYDHSLPIATLQDFIGRSPPDLCFPNDAATPFNGWSKPKRKLDALSQVQGWRLHDLRRTHATVAARCGIAPNLLERLHNRRTSDHETEISRIYNRYDFAQEKADAMQRVTAHLLSIVEP